MKRILLASMLIAISGLTFRASSQCTVDSSIPIVGFFPYDTLMPCIERDLFYDETLQFKNFSQVDGSFIGFPGVTINIISVQIDSVKNMPSGISYTCNTPNCIYTTGENGCVRLSGTTSISPGVYNLGFYATLTVDIGFGAFTYQADSALLAGAGLGYKVVVIDQGGVCPNREPGQLYFNASVATPSVCDGDTVQLHTLTSWGTTPYTYSWSPGNNLSDPTAADPLLYPGNPGIFSVTVTDNVGLSAMDAITVSLTQTPVVGISSDTSVCNGESVQLVASGGTTYSWSPAAGLSATNIPNPIASPSQNTTYTVSVSDGGCAGVADVTITLDTIYPLAGFDTILSNFTVQFINTSSQAGSYLWDFGDGSTSTDKNPQHQYAQHSSYQVTLIANNSCGFSDTISKNIELTVGIASISINSFIQVYPNPGSGLFELRLKDFQGEFISYEIIAACGKIVRGESSKKVESDDILRFNLSDESKGIYFLNVVSEKHSAFSKILVQ